MKCDDSENVVKCDDSSHFITFSSENLMKCDDCENVVKCDDSSHFHQILSSENLMKCDGYDDRRRKNMTTEISSFNGKISPPQAKIFENRVSL